MLSRGLRASPASRPQQGTCREILQSKKYSLPRDTGHRYSSGMSGGCTENSVIARRQRGRVTVVAASAVVTLLALAGCVPSGSSSTSSSPSSTPTSTPASTPQVTSTPLPTPDPLIIPGCDTLLPLSTAKSLFSDGTQVLDDSNTVPIRGNELPEVAIVIADATITKNCIWGIPNTDGFFGVVVTDISVTDAADLKSALLSGGYTGATSSNLTTLEFATDADVSGRADTHFITGDLWIHVTGTSLDLTTTVANNVLDELRLANPTRSY